MAWVKSFDEDIALEQAMHVFWEKGFESTSIADLLTGTGLNRGSFYNAFGSKRKLFVRSLLKYEQHIRRASLARLQALDNPVEAITRLLETIVAATVADRHQKGCFLINTAAEIGTHDKQVKDIVIKGVGESEAFFRRSIEVGQARGDIPPALVPGATAKALLGFYVAIQVLGRGAFEELALRTIAEQGKRLIC